MLLCNEVLFFACFFSSSCVLYAQFEQFLWIVHLYYPFGIFWRLLNKLLYEEIADTKGVKLLIKVTNLNLNITEEFEYTMTKRKSTKGQTAIYKTYT